jgi:hypothetical protein
VECGNNQSGVAKWSKKWVRFIKMGYNVKFLQSVLFHLKVLRVHEINLPVKKGITWSFPGNTREIFYIINQRNCENIRKSET